MVAEIVSHEEDGWENLAYYYLGTTHSYETKHIHSRAADGENLYGKCVGFPRRTFVGGTWVYKDDVIENISGSRCVHFQFVTAYTAADCSI